MKVFTTKRIVRAAVIAALYAALTIAFLPISYGPVQFRISEAMGVLPLFCPEAIIGLTIGCFISNLFTTGTLMLDLVLGTLATLAASSLTYIIGRCIRSDARVFWGILPPILINAFVVPFTFLAMFELKEFYLINVLTVGGGQAAVLAILGIPLYFSIKRGAYRIFADNYSRNVGDKKTKEN